MATKSLTIFDMTDRELLHAINEAADAEGWAHTHEVAKTLGMTGKRKHQSVGSRLGYMRSNGWLEPHDHKPMVWRITSLGVQIMGGRLNKSLEGSLDKADIGQQVLIMRSITKRGMVQGGRSRGMALSREFRHNAAQMNGKP